MKFTLIQLLHSSLYPPKLLVPQFYFCYFIPSMVTQVTFRMLSDCYIRDWSKVGLLGHVWWNTSPWSGWLHVGRSQWNGYIWRWEAAYHWRRRQTSQGESLPAGCVASCLKSDFGVSLSSSVKLIERIWLLVELKHLFCVLYIFNLRHQVK